MNSVMKVVSEKRTEISDMCKLHGIRILALFGSSLSGSPRDVDLAVFPKLGQSEESTDKLQLLHDFESLFQYKVDVVVVHPGISTTLLFEICRNCHLLHEDETGMFENERSLAFRKYADTFGFRKRRDIAIRESVEKL